MQAKDFIPLVPGVFEGVVDASQTVADGQCRFEGCSFGQGNQTV